MNTVLSKKDAKILIEKEFGVSVKEEDIQVGRFFLVDNEKKVSVSPHCVCGEGAEGLGVCFVYYYQGILLPSKFKNFICSCVNALIPKGKKQAYAIYVRAFSGRHERKPEVVLKENSELVRYDQPGHSFIADATEWEVHQGQITSVKARIMMTKMPANVQGIVKVCD